MLTQAQIETRQNAIGASEAAAALDLSLKKTRYDLWLEKTGRTPRFEGNKKTYFGERLERFIADEYQQQTKKRLRKHNKTLYHPQHQFIICHLDYLVLNENGVVDCKNTEAWGNEWGEEGTDELPIEYVIQGQQQINLTTRQYCDFPALIRGCDFKIYTVQRNQELIDEITEGLIEFWGYVERDEPPPPRTAEDVKKRWPDSIPRVYTASREIEEQVEASKILRKRIKDLEAEQKEHDTQIKIFMEEADTLVSREGQQLAIYKTHPKKQFQQKKLQVDDPMLYGRYQKDTSYRPLLLAK